MIVIIADLCAHNGPPWLTGVGSGRDDRICLGQFGD
jgi:hypothetical protein